MHAAALAEPALPGFAGCAFAGTIPIVATAIRMRRTSLGRTRRFRPEVEPAAHPGSLRSCIKERVDFNLFANDQRLARIERPNRTAPPATGPKIGFGGSTPAGRRASSVRKMRWTPRN